MMRNTKQRQLVFDLVTNYATHPTADEIYERARDQDPRISRGTVYRNLNVLSEAGEIRKLHMPAGPDHFDCRMDDHYHFLCRSCNKVVDVKLTYKEQLNETPPGLDGYTTEWHRLILVGLCPDCGR